MVISLKGRLYAGGLLLDKYLQDVLMFRYIPLILCLLVPVGAHAVTALDKAFPPDKPVIVVAGGCCKVCKKSKACGDSCISRKKTCKKDKGCACDAD